MPKHSAWRARCKAAWAAVCSLVRPPHAGSESAPLPGETAARAEAGVPDEVETVLEGTPVSSADTPLAYRRDAAAHLYAHNTARIYPGMLQPQLYAIGVLNVSIDRAGQVKRLQWLRAPSHAPEVVAEIERTVRAAAPFPRPVRMGSVVYTDTWLWDASGRFQLDTLTEGQL